MKGKRILAAILVLAILICGITVHYSVNATNQKTVIDFSDESYITGKWSSSGSLKTDIKTEDNNSYIDFTGSANYAVGGFKTNIELESDTKYTVTFKYKNTGYQLNQLCITAASSTNKNGYDFFRVLSGKNDPKDYNLTTDAIPTGVSDWKNVSITLDTSLIGYVDDTNKYLSFAFKTYGTNNYSFSIDDITIRLKKDENADPVTEIFDFEYDTDTSMWNGLSFKQEEDDNTYIQYSKASSNTSVTVGGFKTSYVLKRGYDYKVSFQYKNSGFAFAQFSPVAVSSSNSNYTFFRNHGKNDPEEVSLLKAPKSLSFAGQSQWTTVTFLIDTSEAVLSDGTVLIDDTYKYFGFAYKAFGSRDYDFCIDNLKIEPIAESDDSGSDSTVIDFIYDTELIYNQFSLNTDDSGNRYISYNKTVTDYSVGCFQTNYELENNTKYVVTLKYKYSGTDFNKGLWPMAGNGGKDYNFAKQKSNGNWEDYNLIGTERNNYADKINLVKSESWNYSTFVLDTKSRNLINDNYKYLGFWFQTIKSGQYLLEIDSITVEKLAESVDDNLIINGGFENRKSLWNDQNSIAVVTEESKTGKYALNLSGGNYSVVSQTVLVDPEKNYELKFSYKGSSNGIPNWAVTHDLATTDSKYLIKRGSLEKSDEWKEVSVVFSSGEYSFIILLFQTGVGCDFIIDDVSITLTDKTLDGEESIIAPSISTGFEQHRYIASEGKNIVTNSDFEGQGGNWISLLNEGTLSVVEYENAPSGNHVLKFSAQGKDNDVWSYAYFDVAPETDYYLSLWTLGEGWSETNKNDMRFGIVDIDNGKFAGINPAEQMNLPAWDDEWHLNNLEFNSGTANKIAVAFRGSDSVAYIDDLQIFKMSDREEYLPEHRRIEAPKVTNYFPEFTGCSENDNLISDEDFSNSTDFWESGINYGKGDKQYLGGFMDTENTDSTKGNALHYSANTSVTGYPLQTTYIKWIDVKPNTEYTFHADYCILNAGGGYFALLDGNSYYPSQITVYDFDADNFDPDYLWKKAEVSFNTKGHDKIGFIVSDRGGEAWIDNVRLFETSKGTLAPVDDFPKVITSDKYVLSNEIISGISEKTTVADFIKKLDNSKYIRVFKGDAEVPSNSYIATGMVVKLMDGITVYDKATVVIGGDVSCDGIINANDTKLVLKYLSKQEELTKTQLIAADLDKNDIVDVNDAALLSAHIADTKKLGILILEEG